MKQYIILFLLFVAQFQTVYLNTIDIGVDSMEVAAHTLTHFVGMFSDCISEPVTSMQFEADDIKKFIIFPSKTTVGFAPKYTGNRKFFANLITTPAFKDMLENDKKTLVQSLVRKLKYCDQSIMDPSMLNDFYDREVDQNKM